MSACGKREFKTRSDAKKYAREFETNYGTAFRVYRCELCSVYHLTTKEKDISYKEYINGSVHGGKP